MQSKIGNTKRFSTWIANWLRYLCLQCDASSRDHCSRSQCHRPFRSYSTTWALDELLCQRPEKSAIQYAFNWIVEYEKKQPPKPRSCQKLDKSIVNTCSIRCFQWKKQSPLLIQYFYLWYFLQILQELYFSRKKCKENPNNTYYAGRNIDRKVLTQRHNWTNHLARSCQKLEESKIQYFST